MTLAQPLKTLLASAYVLSVKAQNFHWNVEGSNFPQYHKFFEDFYNEVYSNTIDKLAEIIRQLDSYAPASLHRFLELSIIGDQPKIPRAELMMQELFEDNDKLLIAYKESFKIANEANEQGIANFIAERIDAHGKHRWMLKAILNNTRA